MRVHHAQQTLQICTERQIIAWWGYVSNVVAYSVNLLHVLGNQLCGLCHSRDKDDGTGLVRQLAAMRSVTFLRLTADMMSPEYQDVWFRFMNQMRQTNTPE